MEISSFSDVISLMTDTLTFQNVKTFFTLFTQIIFVLPLVVDLVLTPPQAQIFDDSPRGWPLKYSTLDECHHFSSV